MEEMPAEVFTMVVPAFVGVGVVIATVALVFWLGAGRQQSYEDAMKRAQGRVEEVMRTEQKQKKEKKRPSERRRRLEGSSGKGSSEGESTPQPPAQQKSILKGSKVNSVDKADSASTSRVDFQLSGTPPRERTSKMNPPTPHPSAMKTKPEFKLVKPMPEEEEDEEEREREEPSLVKELHSAPDSPRGREQDRDQPKPKPKSVTQAAAQAPPTMAGGAGSPRGRKKPKKPKQIIEPLETAEALPASRIFDVIAASSLSDDDIQQLIAQLLEKKQDNTEWQSANMRSESVQSLKKTNQDLQSRCAEAEKTVYAHSNKIKDLRAEMQREQSRHQISEGQLQNKISQQASEISIANTKISGLKEELKQTKATSSSHAYEKLQEDYSSLEHRMTSVMQENTALHSQVSSQGNAVQEAQEQVNRLKTELRKAKEASKASGEGRGLVEKVSELEGRLHQAEEEKTSLQTTLQHDKDRMAEDLQHMTRERDGLSQELDTTKQQLQEAQARIEGLSQQMETAGHEGEEEVEELREKVRDLETENSRLCSEVDSLQQATRKSPEGESVDQVEEVRSQLQARHSEEQQALTAKMEVERTEEVARLKAQYEAELLSVKEQLTQAEREREEAQASAREQLVAESASKEKLQSELEALRAASQSVSQQHQNGPVGEETDDGGTVEGKGDQVRKDFHEEVVRGKEEELAKVREENDELKEELKQTRAKLDDLKTKNDSLRDKSWKARDDMAQKDKETEAKLKRVYKETEERVKAASADVREEMEQSERALLQRLFPDIAVESASFPSWVDQFELQASQAIESSKSQLTSLTERVEELQKSIKEAEKFRETLETTMTMLTTLRSQVNQQNIEHQQMLEEREEMLQRERVTNRDLQQQLGKEKETTAKLEAQLAKATAADDTRQEKILELEERLQESSHQHRLFQEEAETLRHSLQHELELKCTNEEKMEELETRCSVLEKKLKEEQEAHQTAAQDQQKTLPGQEQQEMDSAELRKLGDSVLGHIIPSDSTEV